MVHLDLKPMNLLVISDAEGNLSLKIFDFGSAEKIGDRVDQKGTSIPYASPEVMALNLQPTSACKEQYEEMLEQFKSFGYDLNKKKGTTLQKNVYLVHPRDDIWAIGLIIIKLYTSLNPEDPGDHKKIVKLFNTTTQSPETIKYWSAIPKELHASLKKLFNLKAEIRDQCTLEDLKRNMETILQPAVQRIRPRP